MNAVSVSFKLRFAITATFFALLYWHFKIISGEYYIRSVDVWATNHLGDRRLGDKTFRRQALGRNVWATRLHWLTGFYAQVTSQNDVIVI